MNNANMCSVWFDGVDYLSCDMKFVFVCIFYVNSM